MIDQTSIVLVIMMVFGLGLRHGLDLDHLATIDAISRTIKNNNRLSKKVGLLFSLGHGLVVILLSLIIGSGLLQTSFPSWLETLGSGVSIFFLFTFGLLTLYKVLAFNSSKKIEMTTGLRTFLFKKQPLKNCNPLWIMAIGAMFAFSFDTFTQVALFSMSMKLVAGWFVSLILGLVFMLGMIVSDSFNGLVIASIIQRLDKYSAITSRLFGLCIAVFSLGVGTFELKNLMING